MTTTLKEFLIQLENKKIRLTCLGDVTYQTDNLQVKGDAVVFRDKFGNRVLLAISQIVRVEEVRR